MTVKVYNVFFQHEQKSIGQKTGFFTQFKKIHFIIPSLKKLHIIHKELTTQKYAEKEQVFH